jgi:hypothetical protein
MQQPNHYVYTQSQHRRPNEAPSPTPSHLTPSNYKLRPHLTTQKARHTKSNLTTTSLHALNKQRYHSLSTSIEETETTQQATKNDWQIIRHTKRKKLHSKQSADQSPQIKTQNRYDMLTQEVNHAGSGEQLQSPKNDKPPPIFIHGVINYKDMIKSVSEVAEDEQYYTKSMENNVMKLTCMTPDTYHAVIKHLKENGILCMFFWVFPRRQIVVGRRFGALYQFHLQRLEEDCDV